VPRSEANKLLQVKNLVTSFEAGEGQLNAVNNISFDMYRGQVVALVGESGSGKSMTSLSIMRLVEHRGGSIDSGEILFLSDGISFDLTNFDEHQMRTIRGRSISMIFQDPMTSLNPALHCGYQIKEIVKLHLKYNEKKAHAHVLELLDQVGITEPVLAMKKYPHEFSGGQLQRILIAMSISCNPQLVIADEPTTALDAVVRSKILEVLKQVQKKRNLAILFITHDLDSVQHFADEILVMYAGKIVERGLVKNIFHEPEHPYTKGLLACRPPRTGRYYFLPTISDFMRISNDGKDLESSVNLSDVFKDLRISDSSRNMQLKKIYSSNPLLTTTNIYKTYNKSRGVFKTRGEFHAVHNVSFNLFKGETLGLVGASGCGKSTLARCLVNLEQKDGGKVMMMDQETFELEELGSLNEIGHDIQYIFQDPYSSLSPRMTIGEALLEALNAHPTIKTKQEKQNRINELLIQVGLKPYHFHRYPHEFSGGQRQRICIARALLLEPRVIICDEAVSALDVSVQAQVLNLLNELKYEYGLSYIFISHDLNVVRYMSDRILVMENGRIIEEGESDQLLKYPQKEYTKELVLATQDLKLVLSE
jgi:peptide/nickel transport system ATP-binding protein